MRKIYKYFIIKENKNKSGIYRWNNIVTGKSYIGSSVKLAGRLSLYYSEKAMLSKLSTRKSISQFSGKMHTYDSRKLINIGLKSIIRTNILKVLKLKTKLKISLRSKGVPVKFFYLKGNLIRKFSSIRNTAEYLDISAKGLMRYWDKNKSYNGFIKKSKLKDIFI